MAQNAKNSKKGVFLRFKAYSSEKCSYLCRGFEKGQRRLKRKQMPLNVISLKIASVEAKVRKNPAKKKQLII